MKHWNDKYVTEVTNIGGESRCLICGVIGDADIFMDLHIQDIHNMTIFWCEEDDKDEDSPYCWHSNQRVIQ